MDNAYYIPFKVKQIMFYKDRWYAVDDQGRFQWSKKNDIMGWYDVAEDNCKYIKATDNQQDCGFWGFGSENPVLKIGSNEDGLYVFTEKDTYKFTGNSYETWRMEKWELKKKESSSGFYGDILEMIAELNKNGYNVNFNSTKDDEYDAMFKIEVSWDIPNSTNVYGKGVLINREQYKRSILGQALVEDMIKKAEHAIKLLKRREGY